MQHDRQVQRLGVCMGFASLMVIGCQGGSTSSAPTSSATPLASSPGTTSTSVAATSAGDRPGGAVGIPLEADKVAKVMNPESKQPYNGPTGTLKGHVRIKGDPPPDIDLKIPVGKCGEAAATYGRLFRVGPEQALADALVTVVGYDGFVPEREEAAKITIHGCSFARRVMAISFGQRIEVANLDPTETYMPYLDGAPSTALRVAMPKGDPIKLYPQEPGHYMLRDQLPKPFMTSDVFVLKFATHAVTDLDGEYTIKGIPVGQVWTSAFLHATNEDIKKKVEIKPGDNTVDFELTFDLAKYKEKLEKQKTPATAAPKEGPKG